MNGLNAAHRGYEYQDLLIAARSIDLLLGHLESVAVDRKLFEHDRFDDLTTVDRSGLRERVQFKHVEGDANPLTLATFTNDRRGLKLDKLLAAAIADRDGPGCDATTLAYRIVLRDRRPASKSVAAYFKAPAKDPGPLLFFFNTVRLQLDANKIWDDKFDDQQNLAAPSSPFTFLRQNRSVRRADLDWFCDHLVIELEAPAMSADLIAPGPTESGLMRRLIDDVGVGEAPNAQLDAASVALALVDLVKSARSGHVEVSVTELVKRTRVRIDFGTVTVATPVDPSVEVDRSTVLDAMSEHVSQAAATGTPLLLQAPPGHGKSWLSKQLADRLRRDGWLVAEHYCFIGSWDSERNIRVLTEGILGTLLARLAEHDPGLVEDLRPRFSATPLAIEAALQKSIELHPKRRVALVVDGLDHVSRVTPVRGTDPSRMVGDALADLSLPSGSTLIVLSQPGEHTIPLTQAQATLLDLPGLTRDETAELVIRHGVEPEHPDDVGTPPAQTADAIYNRARGNALYSTYLCREIIARGVAARGIRAMLQEFPSYDGTLQQYYEQVYAGLGQSKEWVAEYLAFLEFTVTPEELGEIQPDRKGRVSEALAVLGPVLLPPSLGRGVRFYHESFSRFVATQVPAASISAITAAIANWLDKKGFFDDTRTYHHLLPTLERAGEQSRLLEILDTAFVARSIAAGFPASMMLSNLSVGVTSGVSLLDWPAVVRCLELARAAATFESERLGSEFVEFVDVAIAAVGGDALASRLLVNEQPTVPVRAGLQMCAALDEAGVNVPWSPYLEAFDRTAPADNTIYGASADEAVALAVLRGRLRTRKGQISGLGASTGTWGVDSGGFDSDAAAPLQRLATYLGESRLTAAKAVPVIVETLGPLVAHQVARLLPNPAQFALTLARFTDDLGQPAFPEAEVVGLLDLVLEAGVPVGWVHDAMTLGVPARALLHGSREDRHTALLESTAAVQHPQDFPEAVDEWLDSCLLAAHDDPTGLALAGASIAGSHWFSYWLRFVVALTRAEAEGGDDASKKALAAIELLNTRTAPFEGKPRACDLSRVWGQIDGTIRRAVALLDDDAWSKGIRVLMKMSDAISTTLHGEFSGPFASDDMLRLILDTGLTPARRSTTASFLPMVTDPDTAGRFYGDLAMFQLVKARAALRSSDFEAMQRYWDDASWLLAGYGYRKDVTFFEIFDPLPELIRARPRRGRASVASVQGLSIRIPAHTDGKETRHASTRWWQLLAAADPSAVANLVGPAMAKRCNLPLGLLEDAREYLWEEWYARSSPVLSGLLRLTLDVTPGERDRKSLERLLGVKDRPRQLLSQLIALLDERPSRYGSSNDQELLERDLDLVTEINQITAQHVGDTIVPWSSLDDDSEGAEPRESMADLTPRARRSQLNLFGASSGPLLPLGSDGLAEAARAWRRRSVEYPLAGTDVDSFANAVGFRFVELLDDGEFETPRRALWSIVEADRFDYRQPLLLSLAEGIARADHPEFAASAYALHWTRSRAGGGWLAFGGMAAIDSLRKALTLDSVRTLSVISDELKRAVSGNNFGVTQAMIFAVLKSELPIAEDADRTDVAFACWDEARSVIDSRAPRVHPSDDPSLPYVPRADDGSPHLGNLDLALAVAIVAGVANSAREQKRRSMLSSRMLMDSEPALAGEALQLMLPEFHDPAVLTWLLSLIESAANKDSIVGQCHSAVHDLTTSDCLAVRALARRLLPDSTSGPIPATQADHGLLAQDGSSMRLWTPRGRTKGSMFNSEAGLAEELRLNAGHRLDRGDIVLPWFSRAVFQRLRSKMEEEQFRERMRSQLDRLGRRERWPNAYLAIDEAIEYALQRTAAGGRQAQLQNGFGLMGVDWEDVLAEAIADHPQEALDLELTRRPRPAIPVSPSQGSTLWNAVTHEATEESSTFDALFSADEEGFASGSRFRPPLDCFIVEGGEFDGWRVIGSEECRVIVPRGYGEPDLRSERYFGLEVRLPGDQIGLKFPPFSPVDHRLWEVSYGPSAAHYSAAATSPVLGCDFELASSSDSASGLGVPQRVLAPSRRLLGMWPLSPTTPYVLGDDRGAAIALVTWRTEYSRGDYELPWPKLRGSAIVARPDCFDALTTSLGESLTFREYILVQAFSPPS